MKITTYATGALYVLSATSIALFSCKKTDALSEESTANTIAVAATATAATQTGSTDSVYLLQACDRGVKREALSQAALPANVAAYLSAHYDGFIFHKAFTLTKNSSAMGYVVIIYFNDKPVGLAFDSSGNFLKVLEQREKGDLHGAGHHRGGRFEHRDGKQRDTVALSALPASVLSYFNTNYSTDTLMKAFATRDNRLVVITKNNGLYATVFTAAGIYIKRVALPARPGNCEVIDLAALPSVAANYLANTYPNYVFHKAFVVKQAGVVKGYVVVIDANNSKYAVEFDAAGNFVSAKTIH